MGGPACDTRDSLTLATAASAVSAAAVAGMGVGLQNLDNYLPVLFAMTFLLDAAQAVAGPTWQALLPRIVGEERTPRAMGTMQATVMIAGMAGPAAGGLLSGWGGPGLVFGVASGCYLAMGVGALLIRTRRGTAAERAGREAPALLDGLRLIRRDSLVWTLVLGAPVLHRDAPIGVKLRSGVLVPTGPWREFEAAHHTDLVSSGRETTKGLVAEL